MRFALRFAKTLAVYVGVVGGGVTLFLVLAPLFGYLPYSDRPGPGWYGSFPALGWGDFWVNAWKMLEYGTFLMLLLVIPATVGLLLVRVVERFVLQPFLRRLVAGAAAGLAAGWWMLGAGWYISAGIALLWIAVLLGAVVGAWLVASPAPHREVGL